MGLDITFYEKVEPAECPVLPGTTLWDYDRAEREGIHLAWNYSEYADRSLPIGSTGFKAQGKTARYCSPYSVYNKLRQHISRLLFRVRPEHVWADTAAFRDKDGYELVNFSDCEGFLGPDSCARIARALQSVELTHTGDPHMEGLFRTIRDGFVLASNGGGARFH